MTCDTSVWCSTYDEDVTVMLARMETLFHFESGDAAGKIARLGAKIVRKLLPLVQEVRYTMFSGNFQLYIDCWFYLFMFIYILGDFPVSGYHSGSISDSAG